MVKQPANLVQECAHAALGHLHLHFILWQSCRRRLELNIARGLIDGSLYEHHLDFDFSPNSICTPKQKRPLQFS